jgi:murein L,D-transpeptidase YcbB/YkuD
MRDFRRVLLTMLSVMAIAAPARAAEPDAPAELISRMDAVRITLLDRLDGKLKPAVALGKEERAALAAYYGDESALLWVNEGGLTERVSSVTEVFSRADEWGLNAKQYAAPSDAGYDAGAPDAVRWLADAELQMTLAVYNYARHAQTGRVNPQTLGEFVDMSPQPPAVKDVMALASSGALEALHPTHPQFLALKAKLEEARQNGSAGKTLQTIPAGPNLKPGVEHPHIALIRERLGLPAAVRPELYDDDLVRAVKAVQKQNGMSDTGVIGAGTRNALNGGPGRGADVKTLLVNMERWRWLPRDLGKMHVRVNIPEFMFRVVRNDAVIHEERIVVGKVEHKTPTFTEEMEFVVLNPTWHVPESIKANEILPLLRRNPGYLERQGLEVFYAGQKRPLNPYATDWDYINPAKISIRQPPGDDNALGKVKFLFPNKHAVYMHDTPTKHLFNQTSRAFSHGCVRVRNPLRFAEVMLADQGYTPARIQSILATGQETSITLDRKVPVHVMYMTAMVTETGEVRTFRDVYSHDRVLAGEMGLGPKVPVEKRETQKPVYAEPPVRRKPASGGFFWWD